MARKRMIDPGIWTDSALLKLDTATFMVFIGLISHADDEGIIEADPDALYFRLARRDVPPEKIGEALNDLEKHGLIERYGIYAFLPNWYKHQVLNRPTETKLQRPPEAVLRRYPAYIAAWEDAFSTKEQRVDYPFNTCQNTDESGTAHGGLTEDSLNTHGALTEDSAPMERKRKEGNRTRRGRSPTRKTPKSGSDSAPASPPPVADATRGGDSTSLHKRELAAFEEIHGPMASYGREAASLKRLITYAEKAFPDDPAAFMAALRAKYQELIAGAIPGQSQRDRRFWAGQPFTPSALLALVDRVAQHLRAPPSEQEEIARRLAEEVVF